jgi:hypothetical protein
MKKIREQIDYGNYPERMDPNLERKLGSPENLYGKNPAMRKGPADVERLVSTRFKKVVDKLREVSGIQNLSSRQVQSMIMQESFGMVPSIVNIESRHKDELEQLAIEAALEETEVPENWFKLEAYLNRAPIDISNFKFKPEKEKKEQPKISPQMSFDIEDLTDEEQFELEKHKRNLINAIVQGSAKKSHYLFQKPEIKSKLDAIDPRLYPAYLKIMATNDFLYFTMEQMIEQMSATGNGVAGKVQLGQYPTQDPEEDEDEPSSEESDTVIKAYGLIFPILCHELVKGVKEANSRHGYPEDEEMAQKVLGQTDILSNEPMQLRIGPEIVEKLRLLLPDEIFEPENKGLINWFEMVLYKTEAKIFLEIMGDLMSGDASKENRVKSKFNLIMKEAKKMKEDYENFNPNEDDGGGDDGGDDDDDDDFFTRLGIQKPR